METTMTTQLTPEDQAAIEAAAAVLKRLCTGPVRNASFAFIRKGDCGGFFSVTVQDQHEAFACKTYPCKAADVPTSFCEVLTNLHAQNPDEEACKAKRVAELREQLARLEGEAA